MSPVLFVSLLLVLAPQDARPSETVDAVAEAEACFARNEHGRAIQVLEAARTVRPGEARLERALARALERTVDAGAAWSTMGEARAAWDRAVALEPEELANQCGAIAVRLRLGEYPAALAMAERALGAAWLSGGVAPPELLELACRARLGALPERAPDRRRDGDAPGAETPPRVGEQQAELENSEQARIRALASAWAALAHARALAEDSSGLVRLAAGLLESEGLVGRAVAELVSALERAPASAELHRALIDLHLREGVEERLGPLYEGWSRSGTTDTLAWFTGIAWRLGADLALRERRFPAALEAYERAGQWLGVAATLGSERKAEAESVRFATLVSSGWCELETGALDAAGERLLGLLRTHPARRDEADGLGRTLAQGLGLLAERRLARNDFERVAFEARAIVALLPEEGQWWRTLGLALGKQATQFQAGQLGSEPSPAREPRTRELFRESWQAYRRAVELLPDEPGVANEAALVQIHHLRDNLAEAEVLLERAIQQAETRLARIEPADERARFPCARSLGNALVSSGYLSYHVYRQPERARAFFERALATDCGPWPELTPYLEALDGRRGPVPEPEATEIAAPLAAPPARAWPAWEASLAEARARARAEGRPLLIYHRGQGLGPSIPRLDARVSTPDFVRATAGAVLLVTDAERSTFVERRHDGRRVSCPRFGSVTCGEHVRAEGEMRAWLEEIRGAPPGQGEEGLWWLAAGAEVPEPVTDAGRLADLVRVEAVEASAPGSEPFEALEASLGGDAGNSQARDLVATRSLAARLAVERILWEGFRSSPARGFLLAALAHDPSPDARALLAACARQALDPELQLQTLRIWPADSELEPVVHAWHWSTSAEVRAEAEAVLQRERPGDPLWEARAVLGPR